jgi:predicted nucleotidyltransferase component of viral defense system
MLSQATIKEFAIKWQTNTRNVAREYVQHLFLSYLYQFPESEKLAFKGGTALRLLFRSPRFSEDLDFTGNGKPFHVKTLLSQTVEKISKEEIPFETRESKPTSGGYLALYRCHIHGQDIGIELNISFRTKTKLEPILATSPLIPSYQCLVLPMKDLVREKCEALLTRHKLRDYYDLYFLLRERLGIDSILPMKVRLVESVKSLDEKMAARELKIFLPVSHHRVISNLRQALRGELNRL